jgi:hypothetical protein
MKMWSGRFTKKSDRLTEEFNASIGIDSRMYRQDIAGSIAHATMLAQQGIITPQEGEQIIKGLQEVLEDIERWTMWASFPALRRGGITRKPSGYQRAGYNAYLNVHHPDVLHIGGAAIG